MAKHIMVKAVAGRIARTAPRGSFIPDDRYVLVEKTHYITRLLEVHGDIQEKSPTPAPVSTPKLDATKTKEEK